MSVGTTLEGLIAFPLTIMGELLVCFRKKTLLYKSEDLAHGELYVRILRLRGQRAKRWRAHPQRHFEAELRGSLVHLAEFETSNFICLQNSCHENTAQLRVMSTQLILRLRLASPASSPASHSSASCPSISQSLPLNFRFPPTLP
jgi:hypothetical protein